MNLRQRLFQRRSLIVLLAAFLFAATLVGGAVLAGCHFDCSITSPYCDITDIQPAGCYPANNGGWSTDCIPLVGKQECQCICY